MLNYVDDLKCQIKVDIVWLKFREKTQYAINKKPTLHVMI